MRYNTSIKIANSSFIFFRVMLHLHINIGTLVSRVVISSTYDEVTKESI